MNKIIKKIQEKNKNIEPSSSNSLNILVINNIKKPENNNKEKKLFKDNNTKFCLFL